MKSKLTVIIPCSKAIPNAVLRKTVTKLRQQTIPLTIILSDFSSLDRGDVLANHVEQRQGEFNLARARNGPAFNSELIKTEYIAFSDADTFYPIDTFEKMLDLNKPVVRGISRANWPNDFFDSNGVSLPAVNYYRCSNSPIIINKRLLWYWWGGYCEEFIGWGYEDSDFEHKLLDLKVEIADFDSKAIHDLESHQYKDDSWRFGSEHNRELFEKRLKIPVMERVEADLGRKLGSGVSEEEEWDRAETSKQEVEK